MPVLFCVVGHTDPEAVRRRGQTQVWPVAFRMERAEALDVVKVCEAQRDRFIAAIEPAIAHRRNLVATRNVGRAQMSRETRRKREAKWQADFNEARDREAAINTKFAAEMFDPLYPTSTNGRLPYDVQYKVLDFWEDPREMGPAALMMMRATLHGSSDENDDEPDEDSW